MYLKTPNEVTSAALPSLYIDIFVVIINKVAA